MEIWGDCRLIGLGVEEYLVFAAGKYNLRRWRCHCGFIVHFCVACM